MRTGDREAPMTTATILRSFRPALAGAVALFWAGACGDEIQGPPGGHPEAPTSIELVVDLSSELEPDDAPAGSVPVAAGLFMSVSQIGKTEAVDRANQLIAETNEVLAQCGLHLEVEAAQVIAVPPHLNMVQRTWVLGRTPAG